MASQRGKKVLPPEARAGEHQRTDYCGSCGLQTVVPARDGLVGRPSRSAGVFKGDDCKAAALRRPAAAWHYRAVEQKARPSAEDSRVLYILCSRGSLTRYTATCGHSMHEGVLFVAAPSPVGSSPPGRRPHIHTLFYRFVLLGKYISL